MTNFPHTSFPHIRHDTESGHPPGSAENPGTNPDARITPEPASKRTARSFSSRRGDPRQAGEVDSADVSASVPQRTALAPGLWLVATPIGNLGDLTPRALDILCRADLVLAEDTRVTGKLLALHGKKRPLLPYHEHNSAGMRPRILAELGAGRSVALASDAGTPLISDPGYKLVRAAVAAGHRVSPAPGASSVLAALVVSGLPSDRFLFAGFSPHRVQERRRFFAELAPVNATIVFFEAPGRLAASLAAAAEIFGDRPAAMARELTKLFEEIRRDSLPALAGYYAGQPAPKGEIVVVIGPPATRIAEGGEAKAESQALDLALQAALATQTLKAAVAAVSVEFGRPRKEVYSRALALRGPGARPEP